MLGFLRFAGLLNAAIWCGSNIFVVLALPSLFSPNLKHILSEAGVGFAAEQLIARFFIIQYWCGAIALLHLIAQWLYFGKPLWRLNLFLICIVLILSLIGGLLVQPKMRALHLAKYYDSNPERRAQAARTFSALHAGSEIANALAIIALLCYYWGVSREQEQSRFMSFSKLRG